MKKLKNMAFMLKTIEWLKNVYFESSSGETPQFKEFRKIFKSEFRNLLRLKGCKHSIISDGHFYLSGFFTTKSGVTYYFNLSDVRWSTDRDNPRLLYRTTKDFNDYSGGTNMYAPIETFAQLDIFD
jgi:hypothetical protein